MMETEPKEVNVNRLGCCVKRERYIVVVFADVRLLIESFLLGRSLGPRTLSNRIMRAGKHIGKAAV